MQQGIEYAEILDIPFVYSSNGDGFLENDMITGTEGELSLDYDFDAEAVVYEERHNFNDIYETILKDLQSQRASG